MRIRRAGCGLIAAALLFLASPLFAQTEIVQVASGLLNPVFVGHAGDGSNRLFIVERAGVVRARQPTGSLSVFLDIQSKVFATGGEQGLLGLAFHPQFAGNGRFFVFYTLRGHSALPLPDGTLVIAEYNVASSAEIVLLTIPHPTNQNHNGGMLAFGPDGYLYISVGDGGSGNDPPNNAQNVNTLLGKILRIDVNPPAGSGVPYVSPLSNPFYGTIAGRDEIFALGMRNPWRFSFDRMTGQQWVGDVGQNAREEVDTPITNGGNYGWRVYEGIACTGIDPSLCTPTNYTLPLFDYTQANGRCSITGGYVYRGAQGTLPVGTYVYGDFCTGEILVWNGSTPNVLLLDTTMNISSFGEDEAGELYVVHLGGTVGRIVTTPSCTYSVVPTSQNLGAGGGPGSAAVTTAAGCAWTAAPNVTWIHVTSGGSGSGNGDVT